MDKPENYKALQKSWSVGRSASVEGGARERVRSAIKIIRDAGLPTENVLVVGPQHGFELLEFREQGVTNLLGVDVVPEFCRDCRELGFNVIETEFEELGAVVEGRWNIYASHTLEHCYDVLKAVAEIARVCDRWIYIEIPIETGDVNRGHCSPFRSVEQLAELFGEGWKKIHWNFRTSRKGPGNGNLEAAYARIRSE